MASTNRSHHRIVVRAAGMTYHGAVYWATDSDGKPSIVMALPMGDMREQEALAKAMDVDATAEDMLNWLVDRIGTGGADVLPGPTELDVAIAATSPADANSRSAKRVN